MILVLNRFYDVTMTISSMNKFFSRIMEIFTDQTTYCSRNALLKLLLLSVTAVVKQFCFISWYIIRSIDELTLPLNLFLNKKSQSR